MFLVLRSFLSVCYVLCLKLIYFLSSFRGCLSKNNVFYFSILFVMINDFELITKYSESFTRVQFLFIFLFYNAVERPDCQNWTSLETFEETLTFSTVFWHVMNQQLISRLITVHFIISSFICACYCTFDVFESSAVWHVKSGRSCGPEMDQNPLRCVGGVQADLDRKCKPSHTTAPLAVGHLRYRTSLCGCSTPQHPSVFVEEVPDQWTRFTSYKLFTIKVHCCLVI